MATSTSVMTYDSLVNNIQVYLERTDATTIANIPLFIMLAEQVIASQIKFLGNLTVQESTMVAGNNIIPKPARWHKTVSMNVTVPSTNTDNPILLRKYEYLKEYSGTLLSNQTVVFPPVANLYVISNQTSGAFTFTATTGIAGKATATIPSSGQATLFCDGQNFYNANTTQAGATALSLANGSASAPTLNFSSETSTGIYRPGTGRFGISVLTTEIFEVNTTGISVTGTGTFSNGVSGGTF